MTVKKLLLFREVCPIILLGKKKQLEYVTSPLSLDGVVPSHILCHLPNSSAETNYFSEKYRL